MTIEYLIWFLLVGMIAGWLAGVLIKGGGFGILGDMIVGILGAVVGGWLFSVVGLSAYGTVGAIVMSVIGAVVLLGLIRIVKHA